MSGLRHRLCSGKRAVSSSSAYVLVISPSPATESGGSASEDIADCFPSSSGGPGRLARLNAVQLELDLGDGGGQPLPANVVVAHLGNPDHGLEAVYLAIPFSVSEAGEDQRLGLY